MNLTILSLPSDVLAILFEYCSVSELASLTRTCRSMHNLVTLHGWKAYLRLNAQPSFSLECIKSVWDDYRRVRYDTKVNRAWSDQRFIARPLCAPWSGKRLPVIAISPVRLALAAGNQLYIYRFAPAPNPVDTPRVLFEAHYTLAHDSKPEAKQDISGLVFIHDNNQYRTLCAGFADGAVMKVTLPDPDAFPGDCSPMATSSQAPYPSMEFLYTAEDVVESLAYSAGLSLSLSGGGLARLQRLDNPAAPPSLLQLNSRGWAAFLSTSASPYAALGTSSRTPLALHSITESALCETPSTLLGSDDLIKELTRPIAMPSATYGICEPPPSFPGSPGQILVTGWFDGHVRIYDLRSRARLHLPDDATGPGLHYMAPVLSFCDPYSYEPIYTVASGGGAGWHVAAGSARHSVVAFWDVRAPRNGWSVHAPGNDSSPVYSVALENSRLFGATESRGFVYDFGGGVTVDTYPDVPSEDRGGRTRGRGGLRKMDDVRYYVTMYQHQRGDAQPWTR